MSEFCDFFFNLPMLEPSPLRVKPSCCLGRTLWASPSPATPSPEDPPAVLKMRSCRQTVAALKSREPLPYPFHATLPYLQPARSGRSSRLLILAQPPSLETRGVQSFYRSFSVSGIILRDAGISAKIVVHERIVGESPEITKEKSKRKR